MNAARIYKRVSTDEQDLRRQDQIEAEARAAGYYIAGVYAEKSSGANMNRPELLRMIDDLQPGDVVIAERIDRISRLPLAEAEKLIASIRAKGAKLSVPGVIDLSEVEAEGVSKIVLDTMQELLLRIALQMSHEDYTLRRERQRQGIVIARAEGKYAGRKPDKSSHDRIVELRRAGNSIARTAKLEGCSTAQVKKVWSTYQQQNDQK